MRGRLLIFFLFLCGLMHAQRGIHGIVLDISTGTPLPGATLVAGNQQIAADNKGKFRLSVTADSIRVSAAGYHSKTVIPGTDEHHVIMLTPSDRELDAVVVSGTLRPVKRSESPIAIEVYTPQFLKKNPAPSLFESLQNVNGVRPQLNCSVCNTGDIHINGLEGPYTMVTIDGMPIVSSLASVYGLFGIPSQLIERIEIVKGPASGLYGSEAIGGLINIITRTPEKAPLFTANLMTTSWLEHNVDLGAKFKLGKKITSLTGINYFNYQQPRDNNADGFTDITLQHRISVFNKLSLERRHHRTATLAARYFYEDRWGGDMHWSKSFRGSDQLYGESIYTRRFELISNYQLPVQEKMFFALSATSHNQDSYYGTTPYMAKQGIVYGQLTWDKPIGAQHNLLTGLVSRYNSYDDNSTATVDTLTNKNQPDKYLLPGLFIQNEWKMSSKHLLLAGIRIDHHPVHKGIFTPRLAWKWTLNDKQILRLNGGTGFRVVNLFTEEHAALTGARSVEILESLKPEQSFNFNINYTRHQQWQRLFLNIDASAWYSHFSNQILPDYDTDPNKIIYKNLDGFSTSKGITLNLELNAGNRLKSLLGITLQDVKKTERDAGGKMREVQPVLTEKWSGTWSVSYVFPAQGINIDYTGNVYGPMRLPLLSALDPRPGNSPVWSLQNIQVTKTFGSRFEMYGGIKNLLNWTPAKNTPFIIARTNDPFDKNVQYDPAGNIVATADNPYALSFDPSYVYAPNQGMRFFLGVKYTLKK